MVPIEQIVELEEWLGDYADAHVGWQKYWKDKGDKQRAAKSAMYTRRAAAARKALRSLVCDVFPEYANDDGTIRSTLKAE